MHRIFIASVALGLVVTACRAGAAEETTTTSTTTTTTTTSTTTLATTTTTIDTRPRSPINGLPVDDPDLLDRRVVAVKVDNHWNARPQSGIQEADAVVELLVEGGLTRFMTLFHHADSTYVGPIRSGRPSDAKVVMPLDATLFISGAQPWIQAGLRDLGVPFFVDTRPGMFRVSGRYAPHNLYGNTLDLRQVADEREVPDAPPTNGLWDIGDMARSAKGAKEVLVTFSGGSVVTWEWQGRRWERLQGDQPAEWVDESGRTGRIVADTLVMIVGEFYTASGGSGSAVPATETVGEGPAYVFSGGKVAEGTWSRDDPEAPFDLETAAGSPMPVPPGKVWISIVPDRGAVAWT